MGRHAQEEAVADEGGGEAAETGGELTAIQFPATSFQLQLPVPAQLTSWRAEAESWKAESWKLELVVTDNLTARGEPGVMLLLLCAFE